MAMNYVEAAQLARNTWFVERVGVAISTYTNYLLNAALEDPLYNAKISVATKLASQSSVVLNTLMFTLAGDAEVQAAGPCISDAQLQAIVEKTIAKFYPIPAVPVIDNSLPQTPGRRAMQ